MIIYTREFKMFSCPQCECETETLNEGYCEECRAEKQSRLDQHNFEFEAWNRMSDQDRGNLIKQAVESGAARCGFFV